MGSQWTADLGRSVELRDGTSDRQVWADTFTGRYHLPPADMPAPSTVLDLGANIGLTAAHYKTLWPEAEVVAVEMDEDCAEVARRNAPGVEVHVHAVAAQSGWGWYDASVLAEAFTFVRDGDGPVEPQGILGPQHGVEDGRRRLVPAFTLRQTIRQRFCEHLVPDDCLLDFLKLDIEGEEWAILADPVWAPFVRHLVVELHGDGTSAELVADAVALLEAAGMQARHHPPHPQAVYAWR